MQVSGRPLNSSVSNPLAGRVLGSRGGVLVITVTLFPTGRTPITNVSLTVNCLINAPPGFTGKEGVTVTGAVGNFTNTVRGLPCST